MDKQELEYTIIKDVPAIFVTEVMVNDAGDRFDIMCAPSGVERALIDGEALAQIDTSLIPNWGGMTDGLKEAPLLVRDLKPEAGRVWGVPLMNVRLTLTWIAGESPAGGKV